ncbi:hypothetical protein [Phaeobacter inhibens]|uniref:hypothetical protein n=1 Tax=Phaeobacter inhibens TaxID=221822 RepID=UPI000C9C800D|nr:hypothetical protein [Phaeobacter inhibens]AUR08040.1 hypothetical protein PhaeoP59_01868 [Phaeobacter inhibens]
MLTKQVGQFYSLITHLSGSISHADSQFSSEVVLPVFRDAVALAKAAGAKSIISDLGSPEDFFSDIGRAKLGQWDELVTVGAKEWATLKDVNEAISPLLSINHTVN